MNLDILICLDSLTTIYMWEMLEWFTLWNGCSIWDQIACCWHQKVLTGIPTHTGSCRTSEPHTQKPDWDECSSVAQQKKAKAKAMHIHTFSQLRHRHSVGETYQSRWMDHGSVSWTSTRTATLGWDLAFCFAVICYDCPRPLHPKLTTQTCNKCRPR